MLVSLTLYSDGGDGWAPSYLVIDMNECTPESGSKASLQVCHVKQKNGCTHNFHKKGGFFAGGGKSWDMTDSTAAFIASGTDEGGTVGTNCGLSHCTDCQPNGPGHIFCGWDNFTLGFSFFGCAKTLYWVVHCNDGRDEIEGVTYTSQPYNYFP